MVLTSHSHPESHHLMLHGLGPQLPPPRDLSSWERRGTGCFPGARLPPRLRGSTEKKLHLRERSHLIPMQLWPTASPPSSVSSLEEGPEGLSASSQERPQPNKAQVSPLWRRATTPFPDRETEAQGSCQFHRAPSSGKGSKQSKAAWWPPTPRLPEDEAGPRSIFQLSN